MLEPSIVQVLDAFHKRVSEDAFSALPGVVVAFNPTTMTADIQLAVKAPLRNGDGSAEFLEIPVLGDVPILYPRGGGFHMSFPLAPGDGVLVVFSTLDSGGWETSGVAPSEPLNLIRNGLNSCVAIPGWNPTADLLSASSVTARTTKAVLGKDGGAHLVIDSTTVTAADHTDPAAAQKVVLLDALQAALDALFGAADFNAAKAAWTAYKVSAWAFVGSSKLKAQP